MKISANQHIFSNVPKEQSPTKRRGYQTLFYTHDGLTREEVFTLEDRAQYYGDEAGPVKHQFHMLPTGKAVVSQIVPLAELDEFGRKGRYLAHSLIVSTTDFAALEYAPLSLFSPKSFITDLATAFNQGHKNTGNIPPLTIKVAEDWQDLAVQAGRNWPTQELERLARLGWQAGKLREERESVSIQGERQAIFQMLAIVFLLTAPEKRPLLTFDTNVQGCDWTKDWPFWAWGGLERDGRQTTHQINAETRKVFANLSAQNDSPYERWLAHAAIPQNLEYLLAYQEMMLRLDDCLSGKKRDLTNVPPQLGIEFARLNVHLITHKVLSYFPPEINVTSKRQLATDIEAEPWPYLEKLSQGFTKVEVAEVIYNLQRQKLREPINSGEYKVLEQLAIETNHLELFSILKLRSGERKEWQSTLPQLTANSYHSLVTEALSAKILSLSEAFCPVHFDIWVTIASQRLQPGELKAVLKQLKSYKGIFDADQLTRLLPDLSPQDKQLLIDWLGSYKGPAPRLRATLNVPEPASISLAGKMKTLFTGKPGKAKRGNK